jgi:hypothetical protein
LYKHCFGQIVYRLCNHVKLKTDSSAVIVTDILVGGNRYNYFVKFVVKNKKGEVLEVSPLEIEKF